jgi:catechol 2,3-dioxygenase-like lactoylglutathione lyase family enzyme
MFDHVTIRVSDTAASERFYETLLSPLGIEKSHSDDGLAEWDDFSIAPVEQGRPTTLGLHVGFVAPSRAEVDEFWRVGTAAGFRDDGAPGPRPQYREDYYGAFLLDPDGNSVEAVHHGAMRRAGGIDHLWIRVADVAASRRFYEAVAPHTGFSLTADRPDYARFAGSASTFSLLPGAPTRHVHMAFGTTDDAVVEAFHRSAVESGYRDNGGPGERPVYHRGYYGAYVLDPDGNNVEIVNHRRGGGR